jgi:ATP adenylyltransferase
MDFLWTPWRYRYITGQGKPGVCVFCSAAESADDHANFVVHRGEHAYVILNRFPYTSGHLMVVPYTHAATLLELPDHTLTEMMKLARDSEEHLRALYHPQGLNIGMNLGESAGAGIAGHLHLHALPRWTGDTSFITVVGETRVLPEDLEVTWQRMREEFLK